MTWQILTVAAKIKKLDKFLKNAVNSDGKIPGDISHNFGHIQPKPDNENLCHKFMYAFK